MEGTLLIKNNEWNIHFALRDLSDSEIGIAMIQIAADVIDWNSLSVGDDLWFENFRMTCTRTNRETKRLTLMNLTVKERFCISLKAGRGGEFMTDIDKYSGLSKHEMREIIAAMIEAQEGGKSGLSFAQEVADIIL